MERLLFCAITCLLLVSSALAARGDVQITDLKVPKEMMDGEEDSVILDCTYKFGDPAGMVVKWFFNDTQQVYQWIPPKLPQDLGLLKGRLNLTYTATNNQYTKHRAMYIMDVTKELSGKYTCQVSTFDDESSMSKTMVVYEPAEEIVMVEELDDDTATVTVLCSAYGVYPLPKVNITGFNRNDFLSSDFEHVIDDDGDFNVTARYKFKDFRHDGEDDDERDDDDEDDDDPLDLTCTVSIPNTSYVRTKKLTHYMRLPETTTASPDERVNCSTLVEENSSGKLQVSFVAMLILLVQVLQY